MSNAFQDSFVMRAFQTALSSNSPSTRHDQDDGCRGTSRAGLLQEAEAFAQDEMEMIGSVGDVPTLLLIHRAKRTERIC